LASALNNAGGEIVFVRIPEHHDIDVTKHWVCQENCLIVITLLWVKALLSVEQRLSNCAVWGIPSGWRVFWLESNIYILQLTKNI